MTDLNAIATQLVSAGRGILAADESPRTMSQRLTDAGVEPTETNRRDYRELLVSAPGLSDEVSGVILCEETFDQQTADGRPFPQACHEAGILPGIKVDTGTEPLPNGEGALITSGLDGLRDRMADFAARGAAFAKWRAVIDVRCASAYALKTNAHALARYAAIAQQAGIVPIVEPEVLAAGDHSLETCAVVTERALEAVFAELSLQRVHLDGIVLKPNFVTPGLSRTQPAAEVVAAATAKALHAAVPRTVPGIAFLSGGHDNRAASSFLAALNDQGRRMPWELTFSFGRALVSDALATWGGRPDQVSAAQEALLDNVSRASAAFRQRSVPVPA